MRRYLQPSRLVLLLLCALLPLVSDAGAGQAKCCNLASSYLSDLLPAGAGDEDFFTVPGGPPSVMILLDNSGSMLGFPKDPPWSTITVNGQGTCAVAEYTDIVAARATVGQHTYEYPFSYSGGNSSSPSWVTENCTKPSAAANACLFKPSQSYGCRYDGARHYPLFSDWQNTYATPRTAEQACLCTGDTVLGGTCLNGTATNPATDLGACVACLDSSGYYIYKDKNGNLRGAFSGSFLNVYPPKYVYARKVLKDLLSIDPATPSNADNVRFGLTTFTSSGPLKAILPACDNSIADDPATRKTNFVTARTGLITALDGVVFNGGTPLAEKLFKVGQYFSDGKTSSGTGSLWASWFPSSWSSSFWNGAGSSQSICWKCQTSSILVVTDGQPDGDNDLPDSGFTGADHTSPFETGTSGKVDFRKWIGGKVGPSQQLIDCDPSVCGYDLSSSTTPNRLHLVAAFLRYWDLRAEPITADPDTTHLAGPQNVSTYTISIALDPTTPGYALLQKTADLGGGTYVNAADSDELANALFNAVTDVTTKATSFSVSNTNTLQASTAAQLFTARFRPIERLSYQGHLYRFTLFNELALGCDPTKNTASQTLIPTTAVACSSKNPNIDATEVGGLADCSGFYLVDADCDPIIEDSLDGSFKKGSFVSGVLTATTTDANPYWDAGHALSDPGYHPAADPSATPYRSADETDSTKRKIYTVLDNDSAGGDGQFTAADSLVEFTEANVDSISPYLELNSTWCGQLYDRMGLTKPATWAAADFRKCALNVIDFIRGWDVLDEDNDGCAGPNALNSPKVCSSDTDCTPGSCTAGHCTCVSGSKGEQRDLTNDVITNPPAGLWKLSDIFHSSPQTVDPPYNEPLCDIGRGQTQCVATIHSPTSLTHETQTAIDINASGQDAYDQWRAGPISLSNSTLIRDRRRIVLAGANDGMLHAFDAGAPITSQPPDVFGSYPYSFGTGAELWAFIPPDLLPKLKYALEGHQYFVDGNIMVRDIWVDGGATGLGAKDRKKQNNEFHTLAILSERSGGTQWTALDVTDPESPQFRWNWPPLCSLEQNLVGQSWSDFAPRPPPIGPVKLALATGTHDSLGRSFEERWVVMINGGYDPLAQKGRGVWMLDTWNGSTVWQFTDPDFQNMFGSSGTNGGMFPVAASPGLQDIGNANQATLDSDGYFDTATWGDLGGQLWVARFQTPGTLDTNGKVTNWFASRAMEELRQTDGSQLWSTLLPDGTNQNRSEFYRMTANVWDPETSSLRTFLGSGYREKLLSISPVCGPANLIGCFQAGCNVIKFKSTANIGTCQIDTFLQNNGGKKMQHNQVTYTGCGTTPLDCSGGVKIKVDFNLNKCGTTTTSSSFQGTLVDCNSDGVCSSHLKLTKGKNVSSKGWAYTSHNRFYGVWAYDVARSFNDMASAVTFDGKRFTDIDYAAVCSGPTGNKCTLVNVTQATVSPSGSVTCDVGTVCQATSTDPGWFYEYGRKCPAADCSASPPPWVDEKTASGATVIGHCVDWNTLRPMGAAVTGTPCTFGSGLPLNYTYLADILSGVPSTAACGFQASPTSDITRASSRRSIAPPLDPTTIVTISQTGSVRQSVLQIEPGSLSSKDLATRNEMSQPAYWLEVPRDLHSCRHVDKSRCE